MRISQRTERTRVFLVVAGICLAAPAGCLAAGPADSLADQTTGAAGPARGVQQAPGGVTGTAPAPLGMPIDLLPSGLADPGERASSVTTVVAPAGGGTPSRESGPGPGGSTCCAALSVARRGQAAGARKVRKAGKAPTATPRATRSRVAAVAQADARRSKTSPPPRTASGRPAVRDCNCEPATESGGQGGWRPPFWPAAANQRQAILLGWPVAMLGGLLLTAGFALRRTTA